MNSFIAKPWELQGWAYKFELIDFQVIRDSGQVDSQFFVSHLIYSSITKLYQQEFSFDMITFYFSGWEDLSTDGTKLYTCTNSDGSCYGSITELVAEYDIYSGHYKSSATISKRYLRTLADFIDACSNVGIYLIWR